MKLKLETQDDATILAVSEDIAAQHIPVLKAGLNKLIQTGKKLLLLDMTGVFADSAVLQEVSSMQVWAHDQGAQMMIASTQPGFGQATSRQEALQILKSSLAKILALEAKLVSQLRRLQKQKLEMEQKLSMYAPGLEEIKKLQQGNSNLKSTIQKMEYQIQTLLRNRAPAFDSDLFQAKNDSLTRVLDLILSDQGLLPVK